MNYTSRLDIAPLLWPALRAIIGTYQQKDLQYTELYKTEGSDKYKEKVAMVKGTGYAGFQEEGGTGITDDMRVTWTNETEHQWITQGFRITKLALDDCLYKREFPKYAENLAISLRATKEELGASLVNNGFNAAFPFGDGKPIFATDHPTAVGTFSNSLQGTATADFSELALQAIVLLARKLPMESGILANLMVERIGIHPELTFAAEEFDKSHFQPGTGNNAINTLRGRFKGGFVVNDYFTNEGTFVGLTNAPNARMHYVKQKMEVNTYVDPETFTFSARANERYSFTSEDPRGWIGSQGV